MKHTRTQEVLGNCERELRALLAEAASSGDYAEVLKLTALAKAVAELSLQAQPDSLASGSDVDSAVASGAAPNLSTNKRKQVDSKDLYPRFFRKGDELVKVGWSKRERREYHQRAPKAVVSAVGIALKKVGIKGRSFNGGDLLPLKNSGDAAPIPDYQAYVALAWMKDLGIVKQRGRRAGYKLNGNAAIEPAVSAAWPKLMEWNG